MSECLCAPIIYGLRCVLTTLACNTGRGICARRMIVMHAMTCRCRGDARTVEWEHPLAEHGRYPITVAANLFRRRPDALIH